MMLAQYHGVSADDYATASCIAAIVSVCLIIAFFLLTSRVYKLLENAREIRKRLDEIQSQQRHDAGKLNEMRDALTELVKAAQWFVDEAEERKRTSR